MMQRKNVKKKSNLYSKAINNAIFTEVKNLSLPGESGTTAEANFLFDCWLSWLHDKREEGWIIAGTDISFESEK